MPIQIIHLTIFFSLKNIMWTFYYEFLTIKIRNTQEKIHLTIFFSFINFLFSSTKDFRTNQTNKNIILSIKMDYFSFSKKKTKMDC